MLSIKERIEVVLLMARHQSCMQVRRGLRKKKMPNIPTDKAIRNIYKKIIESGSVHDLPRSGRPVSSVTPEKAKIVHELIEGQNGKRTDGKSCEH